jgi:hypothetical protein
MKNVEHVTISIGTGNDAFQDSPTTEIARILRELADTFERDGIPPNAIYDLNGNFVGEVKITEVFGDD